MLTPAQVEEAIQRTLHDLEEAVLTLARIGDEAAHTDVGFKVAFSRERLKARAGQKVTQAHVDDLATVATEDARLEAKISENRMMSQRELVRALQSRLSGLQTLNAGVRQLT